MHGSLIFLVLSLLTTFPLYAKMDSAIFAGGHFWGLEEDFDKLEGVISTVSGFDGGKTKFPTYALVSTGKTNYAEAVKVIFDTDKISYQQLVEYFFQHIDPTIADGQFCDKGHQYRSAIFYLNANQQNTALAVKKTLSLKLSPIYTEIIPSTQFYPAEDYHQDYYKKNPWRYKYYNYHCGRQEHIQELWRTIQK